MSIGGMVAWEGRGHASRPDCKEVGGACHWGGVAVLVFDSSGIYRTWISK